MLVFNAKQKSAWDSWGSVLQDVVRHKIDTPAAIFSGDEKNSLPSQRWAQSVIPNAKLYAYSFAD